LAKIRKIGENQTREEEMTTRADGSNAPLRRTDGKNNEKVRRLIEKYRAEGLSKDDAEAKARTEVMTDRQA
jgi:hypothetical protein